jgi:hypothetical protein
MLNKILGKLIKRRQKKSKNVNTITLCINTETQIFNKFTMFDKEIAEINWKTITRIDNELIEYLKSEVENVPIGNNIKIDIIVKQNMVNKVIEVENLIKENIQLCIKELDIKTKNIGRQSFFLILIGLISIALTQFSQFLENTFSFKELVIVMSWVFMWKAIELLFFERRKLVKEKLKLLKMYYCEYKIIKIFG